MLIRGLFDGNSMRRRGCTTSEVDKLARLPSVRCSHHTKVGSSIGLHGVNSKDLESGRGRAGHIRCAGVGFSTGSVTPKPQVPDYEECGSDHHSAKSSASECPEASTGPESEVSSLEKSHPLRATTGTPSTNTLHSSLGFCYASSITCSRQILDPTV